MNQSFFSSDRRSMINFCMFLFFAFGMTAFIIHKANEVIEAADRLNILTITENATPVHNIKKLSR